MTRNRDIRDDIVLAAYAVSIGYTISNLKDAHFVAGIPCNGLHFEMGDVHVWDTSRGWRLARLVNGLYPKAQDSDFHSNLLTALEDGAEMARREA